MYVQNACTYKMHVRTIAEVWGALSYLSDSPKVKINFNTSCIIQTSSEYPHPACLVHVYIYEHTYLSLSAAQVSEESYYLVSTRHYNTQDHTHTHAILHWILHDLYQLTG